MINHPTYSPHHCLVCGVPIKYKHFCSLKCWKEYCKERIWFDYILMGILKRGFVTNQEFTTLAKKYLVKKVSKAKHYIARSGDVFPLYYLKIRIGYISKEFLEELRYRGIGLTYLHGHPCLLSIHKKVFDQALVNYQEAITMSIEKKEEIQRKNPKLIGKLVLMEMRDGSKIEGTLIGHDVHMNPILKNAREIMGGKTVRNFEYLKVKGDVK